ncbi:hypothetical protein [Desulfoluna sp.]|uniref:hypothetical protein n=1 Tax=Desulfoluna sp. TaxID=2045199 RepID=UPI0026308EBA|nr:hypothetical protein [Desulfoluna sp.]
MKLQMKMSFLSLIVALLLVAGCGSSNGTTPAVDTPDNVSGIVADGYLVGAKVFSDRNGNKRWDEGEPFTKTLPGGKYKLEGDDLDQYPLVVEVSVTVIDEDTGQAVGKPYVLSAPMGKPEFISPITTLVQARVEKDGLTVDDAEEAVQNQLGTSADLFSDYIETGGTPTEDQKNLRKVAQVVANAFGAFQEQIEAKAMGSSKVNIDEDYGAMIAVVVKEVEAKLTQIVAAVKDLDDEIIPPDAMDSIVDDIDNDMEDLDIEEEVEETTTPQANAKATDILGSWDITEDDGNSNILTFIDESRYIMIHEKEEADEGQEAGSVEYGTYTWNTTTGAFEVFVTGLNDGDGFGGLWDERSVWATATVKNNALVLVHTDNDLDDEYEADDYYDVTLTRIPNPVHSLQGAYILSSEDDADDIHVLTFLSDTKYVIAHTKNEENDYAPFAQALSGEFGTYNYDPISNVFKVTDAHVETDADGGLFNKNEEEDQQGESMFITTGGSLVFSADTDEDPVYFQRIAATPGPAYLQSDLTGTWYSTEAVTPNKTGAVAANSFTEAGTLTVQSNGEYRWETKDAAAKAVIETGTLTLTDAKKGTLSDSEATENLGWYINAGKDVMTLVFDDTEGNDQGTLTFVKKATALYAASDLTGTWNSVGLGTPNTEGGNGEYWAEADAMTVAENGSYEWKIDDEKGTLAISKDGEVSSTVNTEETVGWFMNAGKDVMATVFNDTSSEEQGTLLFVKPASDCTLTDLTGIWHTTVAATPTEDGSLAKNTCAEAGTIIIDAGGKYHWNTTDDDEDSGTLTVTAEGVVSDGSTETLGWYLSSGKDVMIMVFSDSEPGDEEQGIITFVKQP